MNLEKYYNKKVAILGLGIEGVSLVSFLKNAGAELSVHDRYAEKEIVENADPALKPKIQEILLDKSIEKVLGEKYLSALGKKDIIFRSPGIYFNDLGIAKARESGVEVSSQIGLFFEQCPAKIVGVTGTKGKGTTSSLIFSILENNSKFLISNSKSKSKSQIPTSKTKVFLAGNIGYSAIELLDKINSNDLVILELSSFQLADLKYSPHIAVVTNISVDHLDYHKSVEEYQSAKFCILQHQKKEDYCILNKDSTFEISLVDKIPSKKKYFSAEQKADAQIKDDKVILVKGKKEFEICKKAEIRLFGRHNLENIAAAALTADILGVDPKIISEAVKQFRGLPHRLELAAKIGSNKFINDSFATNPDPTIAAINSFKENKIMILGGSSKGADFGELAKTIVEDGVSGVILIGEEGGRIKSALIKSGYGGDLIEMEGSLLSIIKKAKSIARENDVILFSPACASFDMFRNYKDRGEKFKEAVVKLKNAK